MTVSGVPSTWTYRWDNGKLTSIGMPEGNFEVFCYRSTAVTAPAAHRKLDWQLQWRAKCDTATCTNYSERVAYQYWNDGSLKKESYMLPTANVRKVVQHERDVRGRETWSAVGDTVRVEKVSGLRPRRQPGGGRHPLQRHRSSSVRHSAQRRQPDRPQVQQAPVGCADRLAALTRYPTPSTGTTTCMAYDAQGNPSAVATDYPARTNPVQPASCAQSSCNPNVGAWTANCLAAAIRYQHDDFGNLIEVTTPGASTPPPP